MAYPCFFPSRDFCEVAAAPGEPDGPQGFFHAGCREASTMKEIEK
jgi:hypothetical protein